MTDVLAQLPRFQWRGVEYPVTSRSVSFAHETVQHKLQRRNEDLVEQVGAHNLVLTYTIPMRDGLMRGPHDALFSLGMQTLYQDCRNRESGPLIDPILGAIRCVPSSYNDETDVQKRDGTDVKVEFTQSPEEDGEELDFPSVDVAAGSAEELDVAVQEFLEEESENTEIPPDTRVNLKQLVSDTVAFGRGVLAIPNDVRSEILQYAYYAKQVEDITVKAHDPATFDLWDASRTSRDNANRAADNAAQVRPVRIVTVEQAMSPVSFAAKYGVPLSAVIQVNPSISNRPTIPVGTNVILPDAAA